MIYQNKIADLIIEKIDPNSIGIIAICGAADIGKSYISEELTQTLNSKGVITNHLTLDSFLMSRTERIKNEISGYDTEAYDFDSIVQLLKDFKSGKSISFFSYDHATGEKTKKYKKISPCKILIIDGLHSMHEKLKRFCELSIFVYTDDAQLRKIRIDADIAKRNQTPEVSIKLAPVEFKKYKRKVEPYKAQADLLLLLQRKWEYVVELNGKY